MPTKPALKLKLFKTLIALFPALFFYIIVSARAEAAVTYSVDPQTGDVEKNQNYEFDIILDSETQEIVSGDVYIEYDSTKIEVEITGITKGEQDYSYGTGTCDFRLKGTMVDSSKIRFGFYCEDDQGINQPFKGEVTAGTVTFKALTDTGSTGINLKYIPDATAGDCGAYKNGVEYLTGVETVNSAGNSAVYTFKAAGSDYEEEEEETSDPQDTYLDCVNSQCVLKVGTNSDHSLCTGKASGDSCSSTSTSTTTTGTTTTSSTTTTTAYQNVGAAGSQATTSAVPYTSGSGTVTFITALAGFGLLLLGVFAL